MREMVWNSWCDACYSDGEAKVPALHTFTVGAVGGETRPGLKLLELCEQHSKLILEVQVLLQQTGQLPDFSKAAKPKPVASSPSTPYAHRMTVCPICRAEYARNGMVAHVWRAHRTDKRPDHHGRCPTCYEQQDNSAGLAAHRRIAHGYDALEDALSGVKGYTPRV